MAIARYPSFVIDCPDHGAMAAFYAALLDWKPDVSDDWANVRPADGSNCISFQQGRELHAAAVGQPSRCRSRCTST